MFCLGLETVIKGRIHMKYKYCFSTLHTYIKKDKLAVLLKVYNDCACSSHTGGTYNSVYLVMTGTANCKNAITWV